MVRAVGADQSDSAAGLGTGGVVAGFTTAEDATDVELTDLSAVQPKAFYRLRHKRES